MLVWRRASTGADRPNATVGVFYSGDLAARDADNAIKARFEIAF